MLKNYLRLIAILWFIFAILIVSIVSISAYIPAPIVKWKTFQTHLTDTRTGIDLSIPTAPILVDTPNFLRIQVIDSPDGQYQMRVNRKDDGFDIRITNASGERIRSINSTENQRISSVYWLTETDLLLVRNSVTSNTREIVQINVVSSEQRVISNYTGGYFDISPNENWLVLSDETSDETIVHSMTDERRYTLNPVYTTIEWTDDERYFASYIRPDETVALQILDTDTGQVITDNTTAVQLLWSGNNEYLLVQSDTSIRIFRGTEFIAEHPIDANILGIEWLPDGVHLLIITEGDGENQLNILNVSNDTPMRLLTTIAEDTNINSIGLDIHSEVINYIVNSDDRSHSLVYRVRIQDGDTRLLVRIPVHIHQVDYFDSMDSYNGLILDS